MTARRNPALSGVAGITAADVAALDAGLITMIDLASKLGVTKQAISRRVSRMRSTSSTGASATAAPPSAAAVAPIAISTGPVIPSDAIVIDAMQIAISANLGILHCAHALLAGPGPLGPTAIKGLSGAIASARAELTALGILAAPDDADTVLSTLTVRLMSDTEHDQAKAAAEELNEFD